MPATNTAPNVESDKTVNIKVKKKYRKSSRDLSGGISNRHRKFYQDQCEKSRGRLPLNPVKDYRTGRGLTIKQFADLTKISEHALLRTEQGFYPSVPNTVAYEIGHTIDKEYQEWQVKVRNQHYRVFGDIINYSFPSDTHPLDFLYDYWTISDNLNLSSPNSDVLYTPVGTKLNDTEVCKLLCLNQSVIHYWHNKPNSQKTVPSQFVEALMHNGYSQTEIQLIAAAYDNYRESPETVKYTSSYMNLLDAIKEEISD